MDNFILAGIILAIWFVGVIIDQHLQKTRAMLQAMTDGELIMAMNMDGHFDNKYRREYMRRHQQAALI